MRGLLELLSVVTIGVSAVGLGMSLQKAMADKDAYQARQFRLVLASATVTLTCVMVALFVTILTQPGGTP